MGKKNVKKNVKMFQSFFSFFPLFCLKLIIVYFLINSIHFKLVFIYKALNTISTRRGVYMNVDGLTSSKLRDIASIFQREIY